MVILMKRVEKVKNLINNFENRNIIIFTGRDANLELQDSDTIYYLDMDMPEKGFGVYEIQESYYEKNLKEDFITISKKSCIKNIEHGYWNVLDRRVNTF